MSIFVHLNKVSYTIKALKEVLSPYMLRSIYFSYFKSHLRYGIKLWRGDSENKKRNLGYKQRVIQMVCGATSHIDKFSKIIESLQ